MLFVPPYIRSKGTSLINAVKNAGLSSGLRLCLDAGDANSYSSGQKWLDLSGNGYDFFRGTDGTSQSSDPAYNGTPGNQSASEYWGFDGGDHFTLDETNPTWINNLHKDGAVLALAFWVWFGANSPSTNMLFGTNGGTFATGAQFFITSSSGALRWNITTGSGAQASTSSLIPTAGVWNFCAVTFNEGVSSGTFILNGATEGFSMTYSSPSSSAAAYTAQLGAAGNNAFPLTNGSRLPACAAWEGTAVSAASLSALFQATRARYGI